jgi:hypothetical protein
MPAEVFLDSNDIWRCLEPWLGNKADDSGQNLVGFGN